VRGRWSRATIARNSVRGGTCVERDAPGLTNEGVSLKLGQRLDLFSKLLEGLRFLVHLH
jgi:hypothetical protein